MDFILLADGIQKDSVHNWYEWQIWLVAQCIAHKQHDKNI